MLNTYKHPVLDILNSTLLVAGIALMSTGAAQTMQANGQGTSILDVPSLETVQVTLKPSAFQPAIAAPVVDVSLQLVLGMVLVLLGCGIHALLILHKEQSSKKPVKKQGKRFLWVAFRW